MSEQAFCRIPRVDRSPPRPERRWRYTGQGGSRLHQSGCARKPVRDSSGLRTRYGNHW
jgi:hypothetical protein